MRDAAGTERPDGGPVETREDVCLRSFHHAHRVGVLPERQGTSHCAAMWSRRQEATQTQCSRAAGGSARTAEEVEAAAQRCTCRCWVGGSVCSCGVRRCLRCIMPLGQVVPSGVPPAGGSAGAVQLDSRGIRVYGGGGGGGGRAVYVATTRWDSVVGRARALCVCVCV